jgi:hypothetical protein
MAHDYDDAATLASGSRALVEERDDLAAARLTEDGNP